jgi:hypothetical protein
MLLAVESVPDAGDSGAKCCRTGCHGWLGEPGLTPMRIGLVARGYRARGATQREHGVTRVAWGDQVGLGLLLVAECRHILGMPGMCHKRSLWVVIEITHPDTADTIARPPVDPGQWTISFCEASHAPHALPPVNG